MPKTRHAAAKRPSELPARTLPFPRKQVVRNLVAGGGSNSRPRDYESDFLAFCAPVFEDPALGQATVAVENTDLRTLLFTRRALRHSSRRRRDPHTKGHWAPAASRVGAEGEGLSLAGSISYSTALEQSEKLVYR
jgi:hypothetical protein